MDKDRLQIEYKNTSVLLTYKNNAKIHTAEQIEKIKKSIQDFGFNDPIAIWNGEIVEGHGRLIAAIELGISDVPVICLDNLSDKQRRAYSLVHNKLTMNTGFDFDVLNEELEKIKNLNMEDYGFEKKQIIEKGNEEAEENNQNGIKKIICPKCGKVVAVRRA